MLQSKIGRFEFNRGPYDVASCLRLACDMDTMGAFDSHRTRDHEWPHDLHRTAGWRKGSRTTIDA